MTDDMMSLRSLLEKSSDADLLREMIGFTAHRLMELEVEGLIGAEHSERTPERIKQACAVGSGFLYYVSRTGVTGTREALPAGLKKQIKKVRRKVTLPLAVGFGISTSEQAAEVARVADGVVVGSALVQAIEEAGSDPDLPGTLEARAWELSRALRRRGRLGGD